MEFALESSEGFFKRAGESHQALLWFPSPDTSGTFEKEHRGSREQGGGPLHGDELSTRPHA